MKEKSYTINVHSRSIFFIVFIPGLVFTMFGFMEIIPQDHWSISILVVFISFLISFLAAYSLSLGRIKITLSSKGFSQTWLKPFLLSQKDNFTIPWSSIKSYWFSFRYDSNEGSAGPFFDAFYIDLSPKRRYRLYRAHSYWSPKDDWKKFIAEFERVSNSLKTQNAEPEELPPVTSKEIRCPLVNRGIFIFLMAALAFFTYMKISGQIKNMSWWVLAFIVVFAIPYGKRGFNKNT